MVYIRMIIPEYKNKKKQYKIIMITILMYHTYLCNLYNLCGNI